MVAFNLDFTSFILDQVEIVSDMLKKSNNTPLLNKPQDFEV